MSAESRIQVSPDILYLSLQKAPRILPAAGGKPSQSETRLVNDFLMDSIPQSSVWILKALSSDADEGLFTPDCTVETLTAAKFNCSAT